MTQDEAEQLMRECAHSMPVSDFGSFRAIEAAAKVLVSAVEQERRSHAREYSTKELDTIAMIAEIEAELERARTKFPGRRLMSIALAEEFGELMKAMLDESAERVRKEAIQVAVMAIRVAIDGDESVDGWREGRGLDFVGGRP